MIAKEIEFQMTCGENMGVRSSRKSRLRPRYRRYGITAARSRPAMAKAGLQKAARREGPHGLKRGISATAAVA